LALAYFWFAHDPEFMALLLFAEGDAADADFVHRRAVELQAHDRRLGGIELPGQPMNEIAPRTTKNQ